MKNEISIILISLFVLAVSGCDYNCPGFDTELLKWMPYELGDELIYTNQHNDTLIFTINEKEISEPFETHKGRNACNSSFFIAAFEQVNSLSCGFTILDEDITIEISVNSCYDNIKTTDINIEQKEVVINNIIYNETIIFEKDTTINDDRIWKIILAKNYGIIQFYERETGQVWTLK